MTSTASIRTKIARLECSTSREQVEDEDDDGEDYEDMDPSAESVAADEAQEPEDDEYNSNCPKHEFLPVARPSNRPWAQVRGQLAFLC